MKFIRGMIYPNANSSVLPGSIGRGVPWRLKWIYEFWGFCVNGTSDLINPGGFASNNGVTFPTNFTSGTSLLASGNDGYHDAVSGDLFSGDCVFSTASSAPFSVTMQGKALVMWKPGSNSSEDSIYLISRVISSNQVVLNINTGGTPNPITKHPSMTSRTNVNYRVVDMEIGANTGYNQASNGAFLVLNLDAASINPGQGNSNGISQIQLVNNSRGFINDPGLEFGISFGNTGLWDGTPLNITSATNASPIVVTTASPHGYSTGQIVSIVGGGSGNFIMNRTWQITVINSTSFSLAGSTGNGTYTGGGVVYNAFPNDGYQGTFSYSMASAVSYTGGQTCVNMIADPTFLIAHIREQDVGGTPNNRLAIYLEVPKRLYTMGQDQHPLVAMAETIFTGSLYTSSSTVSYGGGFLMRTHMADATPIRSYRTLVKAMRGDGTPDVFGQNLSNYLIGYNTTAGTIPSSDGILCLPGVSNQYSLARVKLRNCKFTGTHVPSYHRIGLNGEFIQIQNGICWPWDNTIQPQQLLFYGSG